MSAEYCDECGFHRTFALGEPIGRGAMGSVMSARPREGGPPVAIKFIAATLTEDARRRFKREIDALRQIRHLHVVAVLDAGRHEAHEWVVLELVCAGTVSCVLLDADANEVAALAEQYATLSLPPAH